MPSKASMWRVINMAPTPHQSGGGGPQLAQANPMVNLPEYYLPLTGGVMSGTIFSEAHPSIKFLFSFSSDEACIVDDTGKTLISYIQSKCAADASSLYLTKLDYDAGVVEIYDTIASIYVEEDYFSDYMETLNVNLDTRFALHLTTIAFEAYKTQINNYLSTQFALYVTSTTFEAYKTTTNSYLSSQLSLYLPKSGGTLTGQLTSTLNGASFKSGSSMIGNYLSGYVDNSGMDVLTFVNTYYIRDYIYSEGIAGRLATSGGSVTGPIISTFNGAGFRSSQSMVGNLLSGYTDSAGTDILTFVDANYIRSFQAGLNFVNRNYPIILSVIDATSLPWQFVQLGYTFQSSMRCGIRDAAGLDYHQYAAQTFLSAVTAASTYLAKADAILSYYTKSATAELFLSISSAVELYLKKADALIAYYTRSEVTSLFIPKAYGFCSGLTINNNCTFPPPGSIGFTDSASTLDSFVRGETLPVDIQPNVFTGGASIVYTGIPNQASDGTIHSVTVTVACTQRRQQIGSAICFILCFTTTFSEYTMLTPSAYAAGNWGLTSGANGAITVVCDFPYSDAINYQVSYCHNLLH